MRMTWLRSAGLVGFFAIAAACSSSSNGGSSGGACTPGESNSCTGAGGCSGGQVCNADGSGFGTCDCGSGGDAGGGDSGSVDSGGSTDSGSDSGADAAVAFTPAAIGTLDFWIDGASALTADAGGLSAWMDLSSKHHDVMGIGGNPQLIMSGPGDVPAVKFTADDNYLQASLGVISSATTVVIEIVATGIKDTTSDGVMILQSSDIGQVSLVEATSKLFFQGNNADAIATPTGTHLFSIDWSSSSSLATLRIDGATTPSISGTFTPDVGSGTELQISPSTNELSEFILGHNVAAADETKLETYLKSKYGL